MEVFGKEITLLGTERQSTLPVGLTKATEVRTTAHDKPKPDQRVINDLLDSNLLGMLGVSLFEHLSCLIASSILSPTACLLLLRLLVMNRQPCCCAE